MEYRAIVKRAGDDELKHWKYIKRIKGKNGKWRYYYDKEQLKDDLGFDEKETYDKAKSIYKKAEQKRIDTDRAVRDFEHNERKYSPREYDYEKSHRLYRDAIYWKETSEKRGSEYMSARSKLMKTPIGKAVAAKETIENGFKAVNKWFHKK